MSVKCGRCGSEVRGDLGLCLRCGAVATPSAVETDAPKGSGRNEVSEQVGRSGSTNSKRKVRGGPQSRAKASTETVAKPNRTNPESASIKQGAGVLLFLCFGAFLVWLGSQPDRKQGTSPQSQSAAQNQQVSSRQAQTSLSESVPPIGTDNILAKEQIRYCLLEEFRLEGMQSELNRNQKKEIEFFNERVNDFNNRCSSYRYYEDDLNSVNRSVAGRQTAFGAQGREQLLRFRDSLFDYPLADNPQNRSDVDAPPVPPSQLVRDAQQILTSLGYKPGPIDGLIGAKTVSAVRRFQSDYGLEADGVIDDAFYLHLFELRPRPTGGEVR